MAESTSTAFHISAASKRKLTAFRYGSAMDPRRDSGAQAGAAGPGAAGPGTALADAGGASRPTVAATSITPDPARPLPAAAADQTAQCGTQPDAMPESDLPQTPFKLSLTTLADHDHGRGALRDRGGGGGGGGDGMDATTPTSEPSPEDRVTWKKQQPNLALHSNGAAVRRVTDSNSDGDGNANANASRGQRGGRSAPAPASLPSSPLAAAADRTALLRRGAGPAETGTTTAPTSTGKDIASELWSRYAVHTGRPLAATNHAAGAAAMESTTALREMVGPCTPGPVKRHLKLRRAASCNNQWPTTTADRKRRRLTREMSHTDGAPSDANEASGASSDSSRITALVEQLHQLIEGETRRRSRRRPPASLPLPGDKPSMDEGHASAAPSDEAGTRLSDLSPTTDNAFPTSELDDFDFNDALLLDSETSLEVTNRSSPSPHAVHDRLQQPRLKNSSAKHEASGFSDDELDDALTELLSPGAPDRRSVGAIARPKGQQDGHASVSKGTTLTAIEESERPAADQTATTESACTPDDHFDDAFGDDLDDELAHLLDDDQGPEPDASDAGRAEVGNLSGTQLKTGPPPVTATTSHPPIIQRLLVLDVGQSTYQNDRGHTRQQTVLHVRDERTDRHLAVTLRDSWSHAAISRGIHVHVVGTFDRKGQCVVDDLHNMIIVLPDHLISATVVASSFSCMRQAVLQDRIKATDAASKPQVYGMILHEILQQALKQNQWDLPWLKLVIERTLRLNLEKLYEISVGVPEATRHLMSKMPLLKKWASTFMQYAPSSDSLMQDRAGGASRMSINKLLEVEEHVWSPMYGLKGNVDATVQVSVHEAEKPATLTVPFEFKTGAKDTSEAHRAQTAMYCLLLSDRYDIDVTFGILYYLETSATFRIRAVRQEVMHMIQQRNELAEYVKNKLELPPMIRKPTSCNSCYSKTQCFLYHKLIEDGTADSSGMGAKFDEVTDHLKPPHQEFFRKWDRLLTLEEHGMLKFRRELWSMLAHEREAVGRCFADLVVVPESVAEDQEGSKINRFQYTLVKKCNKPGFTFTDSQIGVGEPVVVSDQQGHFALANGYVTQLTPQRITIAVDRRLHNSRQRASSFEAQRNQSFNGVMEIVQDNKGKTSTVFPSTTGVATVYRLDKDEFSNGMALVRNSLLSMMEKDRFQAKRLRELIIDDRPPRFRSLPSSAMAAITLSQTNLNVDQKRAIEKVLSAQDYALVLGMPGTGKTTTIAHIIRALISKGKSVLLTSYTHTAVDNILLKTKDDGYKTLRIGAISKVHPAVCEFVDLAALPRNSIDELREAYENSQIVATTCLGISHSMFSNRTFDYCIVDEASQITLPVCLGPIRLANTFILVGDHFQLPPLVQNREALEQGLDVSLFRYLCDRQPQSVVYLEHQYRMCEEVMLLSNHLIYNNHLKCGTPAIAAAQLRIPNLPALGKRHVLRAGTIQSTGGAMGCPGFDSGRCWLRDLLDPSVHARLVNTDSLRPPALEDAKGSRIVNEVEAAIVAQLVRALVTVGIAPAEIGVVTLYRSQLALLKTLLQHDLPDLEMHTADRFQGRDKEVIIMSCVRSNADNNVGDLLRDYRRVNVAFTRARTKLLIVGSKSTLHGGTELLAKFVRLMDSKGWIYDLPEAATVDHNAEETPMTPKPLREPATRHAGKPATAKAVAAMTAVQREDNTPRSPLKPISGGSILVNAQSPRRAARSAIAAKQSGDTGLAAPKRPQPGGTFDKGVAKQPAKRGARPLDGAKVVSKRAVLSDLYNDMTG
ncbi:Tripartite DNA replication factor [Ascosphaera acerosa]|nr:Tripartite DNA replication factor [Ascosphaera acerosa]